VVSIIGCTGDWFGGWDGLGEGSVDQFITEDLQGGRMPEVIARGEPAILVCHWPGIYYNGEERGFKIFQEVHRRLHARYDNLHWMKLSEIARYWAAKELTRIEMAGGNVSLRGPFACPDFTLELTIPAAHVPVVTADGESLALDEVSEPLQLRAGRFSRKEGKVLACFNLPKRRTATVSSRTQ
jgi:hypothetical protein